MALFKKVKKLAKKGASMAVPGKGASLKGVMAHPKVAKGRRAIKDISRGFETLSGIRGVRKVTKKLEQVSKKSNPRNRRGY